MRLTATSHRNTRQMFAGDWDKRDVCESAVRVLTVWLDTECPKIIFNTLIPNENTELPIKEILRTKDTQKGRNIQCEHHEQGTKQPGDNVLSTAAVTV